MNSKLQACAFTEQKFKGSTITIKNCEEPEIAAQQTKIKQFFKIFVKNLPDWTSELLLRQFFEKVTGPGGIQRA